MAGLLRIEGMIGQQAGGAAPDLSYGLIDFAPNDNTKYYSIPHDALLDLPAGAWAIGVVTQVTVNSGVQFQYLLSSGNLGATPSFQLYLNEDSIATHNGKWQNRLLDDAGVDVGTSSRSSTAPGADSAIRLVVLQSTGTTLEIWFCVQGSGAASRVMDQATNLGALTAPSNWIFGRRSDAQSDREYDNLAGGLFWADRALTEVEIEAIAAPSDPVTVLGANCLEYWRFADGAGATEVGVVQGTVATRNGTWS